MECILVATDGSESANRALDYAVERAKKHGAEILIANIIGGYGLPASVFQHFTEPQSVWFDELLRTFSAEILSEARDRARAAGAPTIALESRKGDVAPAIMDIAREKGAQSIIVGKRGIGRGEGLLLGSISQKLVSLATVPVTVIP